jgi:starch phosphorylase
MSIADLRQSFIDNLFCALGRVPKAATPNDIYIALALTVRDRVHKQGVRTMEARSEQQARCGRLSLRRIPDRPTFG